MARRPTASSDVVLVAFADIDSRTMYAEYLRHEGFHPILASTAQEALTRAPSVDIIVTGLLLPGYTDGIALIERLKANRATRHTPLIVVTSCVWESARAHAQQAGCDLFLPKPCLPDDLAREVRRLLTATLRRL